ncbi:probable Ufm1-specific protease 1 [Lucilia cuprina]|uniref:probable Ufm1-specific protease 1 n=1 Tax=Lucilia cuprina TaxID=7375 RepID=UPI001F056DE6|nr:probable Ufm1-specific protease 1 [Lucilia cuprina]
MDQHTVKDEAKAIVSKTYEYELLNNLIEHIPQPPNKHSPTSGSSVSSAQTYLTRGNFNYYHYGCDGQQDQGWGCAYRTLQSMISWILHKCCSYNLLNVPSLREIRETLVRLEDKPKRFIGSRDWIGALEVFYVVDSLYDVPCKIVHITRSEELSDYVDTLIEYFNDYGGFVMMGGDMDAASKGIAGVHTSGRDTYLLVVDPHYSGVPASIHDLIRDGYIRWQNVKEFVDSSFYNLCLPYLK